jgi:hypothetical protein
MDADRIVRNAVVFKRHWPTLLWGDGKVNIGTGHGRRALTPLVGQTSGLPLEFGRSETVNPGKGQTGKGSNRRFAERPGRGAFRGLTLASGWAL